MSYNYTFEINNLHTELKYSNILGREIPDAIVGIDWKLTIDDGIHYMTETYNTPCTPDLHQYITTTEITPEHDEMYNYPTDCYVMFKDIAMDHITDWLEQLINYQQIKNDLKLKFENKLTLGVKQSVRICPWKTALMDVVNTKFFWDEELNKWIEKIV